MVKRIEQFDIAKAVLIFLVVLGHAIGLVQENGWTYNSVYVYNFIFTFHMPAFFIITGILFDDDKWKNMSVKTFAINRIRTIIVPYLFFELWDSIMQLFVYKIGINGFLYCMKKMLIVICNAGANWFLVALFVGEIIYLLIIKYSNKVLGIIVQIVCLLIPFFLTDNHLCMIIGRSLIAYSMIMLGSELKKFLKSEKSYNWKYIIISLIITIVVSLINKRVNVFLCKVNNPILFILGAVSGTYFILGISGKMHSRLLSFIGRNTLPILGTHQRLLFLIPRYLPMQGSIIWVFIDVLIVFIMEIPFILILNQFLPFLVGKQSNKQS